MRLKSVGTNLVVAALHPWYETVDEQTNVLAHNGVRRLSQEGQEVSPYLQTKPRVCFGQMGDEPVQVFRGSVCHCGYSGKDGT